MRVPSLGFIEVARSTITIANAGRHFLTKNTWMKNSKVSNDLFIENQAFSRSYDWAPHPSPFVSKLGRWHTARLRKRDNLLTGEGGGRGAESYDLNHSFSNKRCSNEAGNQWLIETPQSYKRSIGAKIERGKYEWLVEFNRRYESRLVESGIEMLKRERGEDARLLVRLRDRGLAPATGNTRRPPTCSLCRWG